MSPYPRGWFAVAFSTDVAPGSTRTVHSFGRDLLLFRGADGTLGVFDPTCPHLGAHLGDGVVEGGALVCPFHGWRWSAEGRCLGIPYADRVPARARLTPVPTRETNGVVLVWNDPAGSAPDFEVPARDEAEWSSSRTLQWTLRTHVQEIMESAVDWAHFGPVHRMRDPRPLMEPLADGAHLRSGVAFVSLGDPIGMPGTDQRVEVTFDLHGLGVLHIENTIPEHGLAARVRLYAAPVDDASVDVRVSVEVRRLSDEAATDRLAAMFVRAFEEEIQRAIRIWERKAYLEKPCLAAGERGVSTYRRWARQFHATAAPVDALGNASQPVPAAAPSPAEAPAPSSEPGVLGRLRTEVVELRDRVVGAVRETVVRIPGVRPRDADPRPASDGKPAPTPDAVDSAAAYFATLPERFVPAASTGVDAVFQWDLSGPGGGTWHATVRDGAIAVAQGPHPSPSVTLSLSAADYVEMVNGRLNGMVAFSSGRARMAGDVKLAMRMRELFPAA
jgi:nitrite reductase/ring-hydroxylating ferredoxin subunit/putative sterol carrier protein